MDDSHEDAGPRDGSQASRMGQVTLAVNSNQHAHRSSVVLRYTPWTGYFIGRALLMRVCDSRGIPSPLRFSPHPSPEGFSIIPRSRPYVQLKGPAKRRNRFVAGCIRDRAQFVVA